MDNVCENEKIGYRDVFGQKEYLKLLIANLISRFGDSIDAIAFTWIVYQVTGSASWSAIIFAMNRLPSIFVQPFAGAWVERRNKKRIMVGADLIRGVIVVMLAVLEAMWFSRLIIIGAMPCSATWLIILGRYMMKQPI